MRTKSVSAALLVGAALMLCSGRALGQTTATWTTPTSGNWTTMMVWDIAPSFPNNNGGNTFNAVVGVAGAAYGVTLDQNITIENFTLTSADATLLYGGAFTLQLNQNLTTSGAVINGANQGGQILVNGVTNIGSGVVQNLSRLQGNGVVNYNPTTTTCEIEDTDVIHNDGHANIIGTQDIVLRNNARLINNAACVFTIANNQQVRWDNSGTRPSIINSGDLIRDTGTGVADLSGVTLTNTGVIETRTGTLRTDQLTLAGSTLSGGTYRILGGSFDVVGQSITDNAAVVELGAGGGSFNAFGNVSTNQAAGTIRVSGGRTFTTTGSLLNSGTLDVRASSTLAIPTGSTLGNVSGSTLSGGTFVVAGTLQAPNLAGLTTIATSLTLDGAASQVVNLSNTDALAGVTAVASGGTLGIINGRNFTSASNLTLGATGTIRVGAGSTFTVNGTITNFSTGIFTDGQLAVTGRLQFNNADISTVAANLSLDDPTAQIVDQANLDAFRNLASVTSAGTLSVSNGRNLSTSGSLANAGTLRVGAAGTSATTLTVPGALNQTGGSTTLANGTITATGGFNLTGGTLNGNGTINGNLVSSGVIRPGASAGLLAVTGDLQQQLDGRLSIEIGGLARGVASNGYDAIDVTGLLAFEGRAAGELSLALINSFRPQLGDEFRILSFGSRDGVFATVSGTQLGGGLWFEVLYSQTAVTLVVVPAPGVLGLAGLTGLLVARRRR